MEKSCKPCKRLGQVIFITARCPQHGQVRYENSGYNIKNMKCKKQKPGSRRGESARLLLHCAAYASNVETIVFLEKNVVMLYTIHR